MPVVTNDPYDGYLDIARQLQPTLMRRARRAPRTHI
jgi:hypothetical protein